MPRTLPAHPPSFESSKVGWDQLEAYWSPVPWKVKWGAHAMTVALQSHTWTQALGDGENRMKLPNPWLVEEKVRGHKELVGE